MNAYSRHDDADCPLFAEPIDTSRAAKEAITDRIPELRARVLGFLAAKGAEGATDEQMQDAMNMPGSTQRPRRGELVKMGLVIDSGRRRMLKSGKMGTIWVRVEQ